MCMCVCVCVCVCCYAVADVKKLKSDTCALSTDHTLWPTVLLAQWWKRIKDKPSLTLPSTSTCYPRTLIHHIAQ